MKRLILLLKAMLFFLLVFSSNIDFCLSQEEECGPSSKSDPNANVNTPTTSSGTLGLTFNPTTWGTGMLSTDASVVWEPTETSQPPSYTGWSVSEHPYTDTGTTPDTGTAHRPIITLAPDKTCTPTFYTLAEDSINQSDVSNVPVPPVVTSAKPVLIGRDLINSLIEKGGKILKEEKQTMEEQ